MEMRSAPHRHREQVRGLRGTLETAALLALARRIGLRREGKLLGLTTVAMLDQESKRRRTKGNEAPMVIGPRDVARLLRQLFTTIRGRRRD
jgi:hypothetical protein